MSRGTNQKFKFTYLMKIMLEKTDDEHRKIGQLLQTGLRWLPVFLLHKA